MNTKIVTRRGEEIDLNYKLLKMDGDWKMYDVVIENISIVIIIALSLAAFSQIFICGGA